jgi:hypothetical protein
MVLLLKLESLLLLVVELVVVVCVRAGFSMA